jgi:hypothetical protein
MTFGFDRALDGVVDVYDGSVRAEIDSNTYDVSLTNVSQLNLA